MISNKNRFFFFSCQATSRYTQRRVYRDTAKTEERTRNFSNPTRAFFPTKLPGGREIWAIGRVKRKKSKPVSSSLSPQLNRNEARKRQTVLRLAMAVANGQHKIQHNIANLFFLRFLTGPRLNKVRGIITFDILPSDSRARTGLSWRTSPATGTTTFSRPYSPPCGSCSLVSSRHQRDEKKRTNVSKKKKYQQKNR